jgi:hypothetical protein
MSPWDWLWLTLIAFALGSGILVLLYWAFRAINLSIRKSAPTSPASEDASRSADRMIVVSQLWMGVGLIVFGASIAVLFGVVFSDRDIDKVALSIGTAVIGTGAALLPAGASASASGRINTSIQKETVSNGGGGDGDGGDGDKNAVPPPAPAQPGQDASDASTTTTTTTTTTTSETPPPPPSDDTQSPPVQTAPSLCVPKLSIPRQRSASIRRHGLRATLSCGPTGQIVASLLMHRRGHKLLVVGRSRRVFAVAGTTKLVVRPSRRVRVALAHHRRVVLTLKVVLTDVSGTRATLTRKITKK